MRLYWRSSHSRATSAVPGSMGPANNALELTAPRGLAVARSAAEPRAHSRTGAAAQRGRSRDRPTQILAFDRAPLASTVESIGFHFSGALFSGAW